MEASKQRFLVRTTAAVALLLAFLLSIGVASQVRAWAAEGDLSAGQIAAQSNYADYDALIVALSNNVREASTNLANAESACERAEQELTSAQGALDKAVADKQALEQARDQAQSELDDAIAAYGKAQTDYNAAVTHLEESQQAVLAAQDVLDKAQAALAKASGDLDTANQSVTSAQATLDNAIAAQEQAQGVVNADTESGAPSENKEAWTALGLFKWIRDNAVSGSPEYVDAQCAIDILTGSVTSGVTYPTEQGPQPSISNFHENMNLTARGDAVALNNFKESLDWIDRYNDYRARENTAEGVSLSTSVGMNCRMMAVSILMCDYSKSVTSHSQAFRVGENLSWGYSNPFDGWYTDEKATYKDLVAQGKVYPDGFSGSEQGSVGHYLNIVDYAIVPNGYRSEYPTSVTGFAVNTNSALYGRCHEQSFYTFGNYYEANVIYSTSEFRSRYFNTYYQAQLDDGMNGVSDDAKAQHLQALEDAKGVTASARDAYNKAVADRDARAAEKASAETNVADAQTQLTEANTEQQQSAAAKTELENALPQKQAAVQSAQTKFNEAEKAVTDFDMTSQEQAVTQAAGELKDCEDAVVDKRTARNAALEALSSATSIGNAAITVSDSEYTGEALEPAVKVAMTYGGEEYQLVEGDHFAVTYSANTNAGNGKVTVSGKTEQFEAPGAEGQSATWGSKESAFAIAPAKVEVPDSVEGLVYNGREQSGVAEGDGYAVADGVKAAAGKHTAIVSLKDPQNNTWADGTTEDKSVEWSIARAAATVTSNDAAKTYGDDDPEFTATATGLFGNDALQYSFQRDEGESVGSYAIAPVGDAVQGNYDVTYVSAGKLDVGKAELVLAADDASKTYGAEDPQLTAQVTGFKFDDAAQADSVLKYSVGRAAGEDLGAYKITPTVDSVSGNYTVNVVEGTFTIKPVPVSIENAIVELASDAVVYNGSQQAPEVTVTLDGVELKKNVDYVVDYADNVNVGSATVMVTGIDGYVDTLTATFAIQPAASKIALAAQTKTYNGKALAYSGKVTKSGSTGKVTYRYYTDAACKKEVSAASVKEAKTYYVKATVAASGNYAAATSAPVKFTIAKAANPMTVKVSSKSTTAAKLKKAKQVVSPIAASKAQGKLTFVKKSGASCLSVDKATGKVTVKKGTKKKAAGYTAKVQVTAAGNANYKSATKTITVKVVVK